MGGNKFGNVIHGLETLVRSSALFYEVRKWFKTHGDQISWAYEGNNS